MARRKSSKGFKFRSAGMIGGLAAALIGGGYYVGRNGPPLPEKLAALIPEKSPAPRPAHEARAPESPSVKITDKAELSRLLKGAETRLIAAIRPETEKRAKVAKTETKTEAAKPEKPTAAKAEAQPASKAQAAKAQTAKSDAAKPDPAKAKATASADEAPLPPARIPNVASVDAAPTATIAPIVEQPETKPEPDQPARNASAPLVASLTGKGIPTSEDSKMRLSVGFANRTGKPIRAFEGVLKFTDRNDHGLYSSKISVSALIAEGGSINWDERVDPGKLDADGKKLVEADKDALKAVFTPKKVFFVDGSVQQFGAKGERMALR